MAKKAAKTRQTKSMEEALWESCNKMRGSVEPSEYKHVVLSLIFLKYAGDHFDKKHKEICEQYGGDYADITVYRPVGYNSKSNCCSNHCDLGLL